MKYVIERAYTLPIYQQLVIEADTLAEACQKAIEDDDWESAKEDTDGAEDIIIYNAVEVPAGVDPQAYGLPHCLYNSGLTLLKIPPEFTGG